jgi:dihydrofolate reductase
MDGHGESRLNKSAMAKLIYTAIASLDGFVADESGNFDWAAPDDEVHAFVNDLERPAGTYLYGRRLYETMAFWETAHVRPEMSAVAVDYARIWQAAEKIVYSRTLESVSTARTRLERGFVAEAVRRLKAFADREVSVGGSELAAQALHAELVDEIRVFFVPAIVGGGKPFLPDGLRLTLALLDERRFESGVVYLRYSAAGTG